MTSSADAITKTTRLRFRISDLGRETNNDTRAARGKMNTQVSIIQSTTVDTLNQDEGVSTRSPQREEGKEAMIGAWKTVYYLIGAVRLIIRRTSWANLDVLRARARASIHRYEPTYNPVFNPHRNAEMERQQQEHDLFVENMILGEIAVLWTLLYGFVIFPNHPTPDMLECHEEVYYNNQTEALERDKTCELDRPLIWGLAFLAGVASTVFTPVLLYFSFPVYFLLYLFCWGWSDHAIAGNLNFWYTFVFTPAVLWIFLYMFIFFSHPTEDMMHCVTTIGGGSKVKTCVAPDSMWDSKLAWFAFLAGVPSSLLVFVFIRSIAFYRFRVYHIGYLLHPYEGFWEGFWFPARSQNDTVEQDEHVAMYHE
jgi:hypothetical protein